MPFQAHSARIIVTPRPPERPAEQQPPAAEQPAPRPEAKSEQREDR